MAAPEIRILHNLPRSGGTVVARCPGSMQGVFLLSEVHPRADPALRELDPLEQARKWFGFFGGSTNAAPVQAPFATKIGAVAAAAEIQGGTLLLRDWTHLDFIGFPHLRDPAGRLSILDALEDRFPLRNHALVRHPLPQFRSHRAMLRSGTKEQAAFVDRWFTPEYFASAYRRYAEHAYGAGHCRYEDFLRDPDGFLRDLCGKLAMPFDPEYRERWQKYDAVTGAVDERTDRIAASCRPDMPTPLRDRLLASDDLHAACSLLGYDPERPPKAG